MKRKIHNRLNLGLQWVIFFSFSSPGALNLIELQGGKNNRFTSQDEYVQAYPEANKHIKSD